MKKNLQKLTSTEYDLLIIGGGIYGATAVWDASLRGLKVALIEKGDFGCETSSNSLKIIHGGLRYIQQADFKRMRESIRERWILMHIAPHLVHPLRCLMPTYGHLGKGPEAMKIALMLNDLVGLDRNKLDDPQKRLPNGKVVSRKSCLEQIPGVRTDHLSVGAIWYDCQVYNSERLIISYLRSAQERGADLANYVEAKGYLIQDNRVAGVKVFDHESGETLEIRSKMVLNTSGPWLNRMLGWMQSDQPRHKVKLSVAMNLVTRPLVKGCAAGITGRRTNVENGKIVEKGKKIYFITPWRNYSLVGTINDPYEGDPSDFSMTESKLQQFIDEINYALPGNQLSREDVYFYHAGLVPMERPDPKSGEVVVTKQYKIFDHSKEDNIDGVVSVLGVKYTTARDVSVKVIDLVMKKLNKEKMNSQTEKERIFGGEINRFDDFLNQARTRFKDKLSDSVIDQLVRNYGSEFPRVLKYGEENPDWLKPFKGTSVLPAEIIHAVREEMVVHLSDVVLRRTEMGSAGNPGDAVLFEAAKLIAEELGWDEKMVEKEIEMTKGVYELDS